MRTLNIIFWIGYLYTLYLFTPLESICTDNAVCVQEMLRDFTGAYLAVTISYFMLVGFLWMLIATQMDDCNGKTGKNESAKKERK